MTFFSNQFTADTSCQSFKLSPTSLKIVSTVLALSILNKLNNMNRYCSERCVYTFCNCSDFIMLNDENIAAGLFQQTGMCFFLCGGGFVLD